MFFLPKSSLLGKEDYWGRTRFVLLLLEPPFLVWVSRIDFARDAEYSEGDRVADNIYRIAPSLIHLLTVFIDGADGPRQNGAFHQGVLRGFVVLTQETAA